MTTTATPTIAVFTSQVGYCVSVKRNLKWSSVGVPSAQPNGLFSRLNRSASDFSAVCSIQ